MKDREIVEYFYSKNFREPVKEMIKFKKFYAQFEITNKDKLFLFGCKSEIRIENISPKLLEKWIKVIKHYMGSFKKMDDNFIPAIYYGTPKYVNGQLTFSIPHIKAIEMREQNWQAFRRALAAVFGKVKIEFTQF